MKKGHIYIGKVLELKFPNKGIVEVESEEVELKTAEAEAIESGGPPSENPSVSLIPVSEGGRCIVKNVLPGQRVRFRVNKKKSGLTEGRLLSVVEKSPLEIVPPCPHFGICGGCAYQNLAYEDQLKLKEKQVLELLYGVNMPEASPFQTEDWVNEVWEGIKPSPAQFEYRNKMEFSFGDASMGGELELGLHKIGSVYDIVTVKKCRLVDEDYRRILTETLAYFRGKETPYYHKKDHTGFLRHLLIRKAARTGEILIDLVTTSEKRKPTICTEVSLLEDWKEALLSLKLKGRIAGILHTVNDSVADAIKDEGTQILYGQDHIYEELLFLRFKITPFSFFQTNTLSAEVVYRKAREYIVSALSVDPAQNCPDSIIFANMHNETSPELQIGEEKRLPGEQEIEKNEQMHGKNQPGTGLVIFDLYSGTGTIAQLMSSIAKKVVGVELVPEAVKAARENAEFNGLHNCDFLEGDVLRVIDQIEEKPDLIILDPPRDGIHPKAIYRIMNYNVPYIVYISCKPTSLARDLEIFAAHGYYPKRACAIDQFPAAGHVETVVLLTRQNT
ncbi:MAG: class I SAM-dependent RNA methyltransferase [Lachnospiraceae bacterium]|nr:class I SAM-dependent RNA methyltransferase [Lachnospiraceae bacterium]